MDKKFCLILAVLMFHGPIANAAAACTFTEGIFRKFGPAALKTLNPYATISFIAGNTQEAPVRGVSSVAVLSMSNPADVAALNDILDGMRVKRDRETAHLAPTLDKMVDWFKAEHSTTCPKSILKHPLSLKLVAEATFWSQNLSLKGFLDKMTYEEVRTFQPLGEMHLSRTPLGAAVKEVTRKMVAPSMSHEASFALQQAAWVLYIKRVGKEVFDREKAEYDAKKELK